MGCHDHDDLDAHLIIISYRSVCSKFVGYHVNCMGGETEIHIDTYSYAGNGKKALRLAAGRANKVRSVRT